MKKNIFEINTDVKKIKFIANRDNGKWALSMNPSPDLKKNISGNISKTNSTNVGKIVLNMGRACNFNCSYCLIGESKELNLKLHESTGIKALERVAELDASERHIVFHGSEPMMNYKTIKRLIKFNKQKLGESISFSLQSNGTLFNQKNLEFLIESGVGIGISLDGLKKHQNLQRPYSSGKPSYKDVINAMNLVDDIQGDISTISVITSGNVNDLPKIRENFESKGLKSVLFAPVMTPDTSIRPNQKILFQQMKNLFEEYVNNLSQNKNPMKIRNFRDYLRIFFKEKNNSNCLQCGGGKIQPILAIDCDGSIYPCDFFWGDKDYKIGDIEDISLRDALNSKLNMRNFRDVDKISSCGDICNWKMFCAAGCPGGNMYSGKQIDSQSVYCEYNRQMFEYIAKKLPVLHEKGLIAKLLE